MRDEEIDLEKTIDLLKVGYKLDHKLDNGTTRIKTHLPVPNIASFPLKC